MSGSGPLGRLQVTFDGERVLALPLDHPDPITAEITDIEVSL